ncbi:hypothetical protein CP533_1584 [Ophiocordyceps camponoti-saundersi (nom. inval.)]|nr:hypothetical protein CP533_1584 [Ophiocordyceps camponoti-saundersi (nom. inval.)]
MSLFERIQWRPPEPSSFVSDFDRRYQKEKQQPFRDERLMDETTITCAWADFRRPLLKRCNLQGNLNFIKLLGYGMDGIVWKAEIGRQVVALKVFWDNQAPGDTQYWALQRECQNASILQMIRLAVEQDAESIWLNPEPKTLRGALQNLHAFSDEGRRRQRFRDTPGAINYSNLPQTRKAFGWTTVESEQLYALRAHLRPRAIQIDGLRREISGHETYYAIVYEYLPDHHGAFAADVVQSSLDLFWLSGFCLVPFRAANWKSPGILLDLADLF